VRASGQIAIGGALALALAACGFSGNGAGDDTGDDTPPPADADPAARDADPAAPDAEPLRCDAWMPRSGLFDPCAIDDMIGAALTLTPGSWTYHTETGQLDGPSGMSEPPHYTLMQGAGPEVEVLSIAALTVVAGADLRVVGTRPLIIASWSTIAIDGEVDVASIRDDDNENLGAGANGPACVTPENGAGGGGNAGGGGGGGFGGHGGPGGDGNQGNNAGGEGAASIDLPGAVVGGCAGGRGGGGGGQRGAGGAGGGAVLLAAVGAVTIDGEVRAGGAGGQGARPDDGGGGGGGSGGFLGIDAPSVSLGGIARLTANGGGGGAGCNSGDGTQGENGRPDDMRAAGGPGNDCGGGADGGLGGAADNTDGGPGEESDDSGGGGGGGTGFIVIWTAGFQSGGIISPAATTP
jgi:hypothetical protein